MVTATSRRAPPAIPPGTTGRGKRAFRHPAWRKSSSTDAAPNRFTPTRRSPTARCSRPGSDREAPSYIRFVEVLSPPRQNNIATVHHNHGLRQFLSEIEILFDQQDGHVAPRAQ